MKDEPKLRQQRGIYYIEYYQNDKRKRDSLSTRNKRKALYEWKKFCVDYAEGLIPESGRLTLRIYTDQKIKEYEHSASTDRMRAIKRAISALIDCYGENTFLDEVTSTEAKRFIPFRKSLGNKGNSHKKKSLSHKTINNDLQIIKRLFTEAYDEDKIRKNSFLGIKYLDHRPEERDALTATEINILLSDGVPAVYRRVIEFLLLTGCRLGEALKLEWNQVDFVNEEVAILKKNTKNNKSKTLTISPELEKLLKSTPRTSHLVFVNKFNRRHQNFSVNFTKYRKRLNIRDGITTHCLRHTTATYLIRLGYPIAFISKYLGHSDIRVTMNMYGHLIKDDLIDMSNELGGTIRSIREEEITSEELQ